MAGATGYDVNLLYFQNEYHYRIETNMTGTSRRIYIKDGERLLAGAVRHCRRAPATPTGRAPG